MLCCRLGLLLPVCFLSFSSLLPLPSSSDNHRRPQPPLRLGQLHGVRGPEHRRPPGCPEPGAL